MARPIRPPVTLPLLPLWSFWFISLQTANQRLDELRMVRLWRNGGRGAAGDGSYVYRVLD